MPYFDFRCARGHVHEALVSRETRDRACETCGSVAHREIGVPNLPTIHGPALVPRNQRPVKLGQFMEASQEIEREFHKAEEAAQRKLPPLDLWGPAKKRAAAVLAGKAPPPAGWTPPAELGA